MIALSRFMMAATPLMRGASCQPRSLPLSSLGFVGFGSTVAGWPIGTPASSTPTGPLSARPPSDPGLLPPSPPLLPLLLSQLGADAARSARPKVPDTNVHFLERIAYLPRKMRETEHRPS